MWTKADDLLCSLPELNFRPTPGRSSRQQDTIVETSRPDYSSQLSINQYTRYRSDKTWYSDLKPRPNWPRNRNVAPNAARSSAPLCDANVATKYRSDTALVGSRGPQSTGTWLTNQHSRTAVAALYGFWARSCHQAGRCLVRVSIRICDLPEVRFGSESKPQALFPSSELCARIEPTTRRRWYGLSICPWYPRVSSMNRC